MDNKRYAVAIDGPSGAGKSTLAKAAAAELGILYVDTGAIYRRALVQLLKHFTMPVTGPRPVAEAIITSGGVKVGQVQPATMASKLVQGLYFAGEILDVDAYTGGFNLQIAWATGHCAGVSAAEE